jgi:hypothetical protein
MFENTMISRDGRMAVTEDNHCVIGVDVIIYKCG